MFHTFSVHKSVDALKVLATGVVSSLLAVQLAPTIAQQVEQPIAQLADSSSPNPTVVTQQDNQPTLWLVAAAVGGVAIGVALKERGNRQGSTTDSGSFTGQKAGVISFDQASRKLQRRLLTLLHDDREAAKRLFTQAQFKFPNKTADWYSDKVIYDLERDRGGL
ncbi:hypothetical protein [Fischerella thermalis]|uniref:hypothetical protein n=1 Tax=Fischerella thermalis TaxID=372787 RepID=UPI000C7FE752|nr:hypothetical protein [Fischerella thermalis]PLZ27264.1 hypothetical protein CBP29_04620 [Fischerella thermalis WC341]PLZ63160.1 hypothetical protein CBP22_21035 [Fischerella thermalis WC249]PLZ66118.1 hypothetical protein CBP21_19030 [Fischerella thermalis WC246]PLZ75678.1 hypothetical protein CBP14_09460 [Fischerella thermalis WC245]